MGAADFATGYAEWLGLGEHRAAPEVVDEIRTRIAMLPGTRADRDAVRALVKRITGPKVADLRQCDVEAVSALVAQYEPVHGPPSPPAYGPPSPVIEAESEAA